jgi:hypothetical protein
MKRSLHVFAATVAVLLFAGADARAAFINWSYNWDRAAPSLVADSGGTGGVAFTNEPMKNATGSSDIVATNLRVFSSATSSKPDMLTKGGAYTLSLTLTDQTSGKSGTVSFMGKLTGFFTANNSNLTNTFIGPLTKVLALGKNTYTITLTSFSPPGPPSASNAGSIAAHVDVNSLRTQQVPEPSTMLLSFLGVSFLGAASWRKRRLNQVVAPAVA